MSSWCHWKTLMVFQAKAKWLRPSNNTTDSNRVVCSVFLNVGRDITNEHSTDLLMSVVQWTCLGSTKRISMNESHYHLLACWWSILISLSIHRLKVLRTALTLFIKPNTECLPAMMLHFILERRALIPNWFKHGKEERKTGDIHGILLLHMLLAHRI